MELLTDERRLLLLLQDKRVVKQADLAEQLHLSAKTLQRLLSKVNCYRSLNCNATFVALATTPRFDTCGLWTSQGVCFSRHGTLSPTLRFLIDQSPNGRSRMELQDLVQTSVHNHLSLLLRQKAIATFLLDRHTIYTSADPQRCHQQERARRPIPPGLTDPTLLPPGLDSITVVRLLVQLLHKPDASSASLAKFLQARHLGITLSKFAKSSPSTG